MREREIEPNYSNAVKVWWTLFWRSMMCVLILGSVVGLIFGFLGKLTGIEFRSFVESIGPALGFVAMIWVTKNLMSKGFGLRKKYRLALMEKENA